METASPVYELLYRCEKLGIKVPRNYDLMAESQLLELLMKELKRK
jgi:hypothetical protein